MSDILELKDVSFFAQDRSIVEDFSWQYGEGKTTALVGPSGGGKSTVLKLSAGLLVPSRGEVCFRDKNIAHMSHKENLEFRAEAAFVFQDSALWANQNLLQTLELPLQIHFPRMSQGERKKRIEEVLKEVGYKKELAIRPSMLSMGEQKLIGFARAMVCRPRLLFLDEWTESLDGSAAGRLVNLVKSRQAAHDTVIFVSHDLRIIRDLADQVLMIQDGKLLITLTREQLDSDANLAQYLEKGIAS
jgi:ABC-type transporter Mla maintaining outer membrane lipid asymmetry ATPase subunit MlaF